MNERDRGQVPLSDGVWPPAPLRDEPPPLFLRVEGMQLTRSGDRLAVLNISIRRLFLVQVCCLVFGSLSPMISFWTSPLHHATLPGLLAFVVSDYRFICGLFLIMLSGFAIVWCILLFSANLGSARLEKRERTVKAGGRRERPMSRIKAVDIKPMPNTFLGRQYIVSLLWSSDEPTPHWQKALISTPGNKCFLGAFRQEANAERVAAMVAEFAEVSVRHEAIIKPVSL